MTCDRPLTGAELDEVNDLSSHIEASSSHVLIEYHWGDFKHDPIKVLREFFDGFLYWANWDAPELVFRFPHGILPKELLDDYDLDEFLRFTQHKDYDILDIHFSEMESPDEWVDYELGSLIGIRDELMNGDLRALYIVWLANRNIMGSEDEDEESRVPMVPSAFGMPTEAQQELADLLQVPQELLDAAAQHSKAGMPSTTDDIVTWVKLLPPERSNDYLIRLAHNEPGLSRLLVKELRELNQDKASTAPQTGERVSYATLLAFGKEMKDLLERKIREQQQAAYRDRLQNIHDHQDTYWQQADKAASRGSSTGYDEAVRLLLELRETANQFQVKEFQERFRT